MVLALLLTACPSDDSDETLRDVEVYRVVIAVLVGDFTPDPPAPDENPIVFVESFVPGGISLEVQVELVSVFSEEY